MPQEELLASQLQRQVRIGMKPLSDPAEVRRQKGALGSKGFLDRVRPNVKQQR
jgi:hypothetical protein